MESKAYSKQSDNEKRRAVKAYFDEETYLELQTDSENQKKSMSLILNIAYLKYREVDNA